MAAADERSKALPTDKGDNVAEGDSLGKRTEETQVETVYHARNYAK